MVKLSAGVSLIELMVVISIMGLLLVVAAPLTGNWVTSTKLQTARAALSLGVSRAKAAALRNGGALSGDSAAGILCLSGSTLKVFAGTSAAPATCSTTAAAAWSGAIDSRISLSADGAPLTCVAFNDRSVPVNPASTGGTDNCSTSNSIALSAGGMTINVTVE